MDIEPALQNWARWVRDRPIQGHCASIEHRYRMKWRPDNAPTGWGDWSGVPAAPPLPPIDALQALDVERVMRHLSGKHRLALRLFYVYRVPHKLTCKRLHLSYAAWDGFLSDAQCCVKNLLTRRNSQRIVRPHSDLPNLPR